MGLCSEILNIANDISNGKPIKMEYFDKLSNCKVVWHKSRVKLFTDGRESNLGRYICSIRHPLILMFYAPVFHEANRYLKDLKYEDFQVLLKFRHLKKKIKNFPYVIDEMKKHPALYREISNSIGKIRKLHLFTAEPIHSEWRSRMYEVRLHDIEIAYNEIL